MVTHVPTPVFAAMSIISFLCGRYSYLLIKNRYIEERIKELTKVRDAANEQIMVLSMKDEEIRNKWKSMVEDFAKYNAYIESDTEGKWSEWDDVYLNSWISAEK